MFTKSFQFSNVNVASQLLDSVVLEVCAGIDSPRSLAVWMLYHYNEHEQLVSLEINPSLYLDSHTFADDYLVTEFLSKANFLSLGRDPKAAAFTSFKEYEESCSLLNKVFLTSLNANARGSTITSRVSEKLRSLLPPLSKDILQDIFDRAVWGPGVSSSAKGKLLSRYAKLKCELHATPDLIACGAHFFVNSIPAWANFHLHTDNEAPASLLPLALTAMPGNKLTTVPKNAKTERTIAVEPHVNAILQRGVGVFLRERLRAFGCNLRSQERNQHLARVGSITGRLATIDLKGASDTISSKLVDELLPSDWSSFLNNLRSKFYFLEGSWHRYHKHSSMGNGYTFELESAIFYSLALCVCEFLSLPTKDVSVYGDDIVIPVEATSLFMEMVELYGFKVNSKKTFTAGPFRESCGQDFFNGINVRPFYIRAKLDNLASVYTLANLIRRYASLRNGGLGCDSRFRSAWNILFNRVPKAYRFVCPEGYGDAGFITEFDEACPDVAKRIFCDWNSPSFDRRRTFGFLCKGLTFKGKQISKKDANLSVASALWDMELGESPKPYQNTNYRDDYLSLKAPTDRTKHSMRSVGVWTKKTMWYSIWSGPGTWI